MRILGVAPASDHAALVVIETDGTNWNVVTSETRKVTLGNHQDPNDLKSFRQAMETFLTSHGIDRVIVRRCSYKGTQRSGAAAIKMEVLLQILDLPVELIPSQSITRHATSTPIERPQALVAYQDDAFATALFALKK